jgi:hypothetical protein
MAGSRKGEGPCGGGTGWDEPLPGSVGPEPGTSTDALVAVPVTVGGMVAVAVILGTGVSVIVTVGDGVTVDVIL